jgi:hypothetical protein
VLFSVFVFGFVYRSDAVIMAAAWCMAAWAPLMASCGYLATRRAWQGHPEDELMDVVLPALAVVGTVGITYWIVH